MPAPPVIQSEATSPDSVADAAVFLARCDLGEGALRVAVKDVIDVAGLTTTCGSASRKNDLPATVHADIIAHMLAANCRIVGKTNLHECAYGVTGINRGTGTPINVRYPGLIPGGSSSGSAVAVAAGLCDFAIGTDTGGSIRIPAACCGVFGAEAQLWSCFAAGFDARPFVA